MSFPKAPEHLRVCLLLSLPAIAGRSGYCRAHLPQNKLNREKNEDWLCPRPEKAAPKETKNSPHYSHTRKTCLCERSPAPPERRTSQDRTAPRDMPEIGR